MLLNQKMKPHRLSKQSRKEICVHEAAHGVIAALAGVFVHRLSVAPEGWPLDADWQIKTRKGVVVSNLLGVCESSEDYLPFQFLEWIEDESVYQADRKGFRSMVRQRAELLAAKRGSVAEYGTEARRRVRAHICVLVAGPIGEGIFAGIDEPIYLEDDDPFPSHDLTKAEALSLLLPYRNEYKTACASTEKALRDPELWGMVIRLADELEQKGDLKECEKFLPKRRPCWPRSSRCGAISPGRG